MRSLTISFVLFNCVIFTSALENGLELKPHMGFNTYNDVGCSPNHDYMINSIDLFVSKGFLAAGYKYFQIDCGWQGTKRNETTGAIIPDSSAFPMGLEPISSYARSKGFKWAMYSDAGLYSCDTSFTGRLGSLGNEVADAKYFKSLNTEHLKYDNCYVTANKNAPKDPDPTFVKRYSAMRDAIVEVGANNTMALEMCQWGVPYSSPTGLQGPAQFSKDIVNNYRLSDDSFPGWKNIVRIINQSIHILRNFTLQSGTSRGFFADADLLQVGNPILTLDEQASHFAYWAMMKSPLMVSTNLSSISEDSIKILQNKDLIKINQDSAGIPIQLVQRFTDNYDLFSGPLANGDYAVLLLEQGGNGGTFSVNFSDFNITSADVKNLWTGEKVNSVTSYNATIAAHGSIALRLRKVKQLNSSTVTTRRFSAMSGAIADGATIRNCSGCSTGKIVTNIIHEGNVLISGIKLSKSNQTILFDYVNCQVEYGPDGTNELWADITVNSAPPKPVSFPFSGYDCDKDVYKGYPVQLSHFNPNSENYVLITASNKTNRKTPAPDFDSIVVPIN